MKHTNRLIKQLLSILLLGLACQSLQMATNTPTIQVNLSGLGAMTLPQNAASLYAFVDVNVLTMEQEEILTHQTVLVANQRITAITPADQAVIPPSSTLIAGSGKFLLPGLADMHIHLRDKFYLLLLLLNGVTTVRNMDGTPQHLLWRDQIASGQWLGPTIFTTGPILGESFTSLPTECALRSYQELQHRVAEEKQLGYDAIKVYDSLSIIAYYNVMASARANHIEVVGHVPDSLRLIDVVEAGQRSIEHLDGYFAVSDDQMAAVIKELIAHDVWTVPTLIALQALKSSDSPLAAWQQDLPAAIPNVTTWFADLPSDFAQRGYHYVAISAIKQAMIARLADSGAPLLLGTDAPMPYTVPGFAVHQELQNLVAAGLSPYAALRTATYNPALFLHQVDKFGSVTIGKRADLLLVNANPLTDIDNLRQISGVMVKGVWLPRAVIVDWVSQLASDD